MLNKFDIVSCQSQGVMFAVVLSDTIKIPYYTDGIASDFAFVPLDIQNPEEWRASFNGHICFDLLKREYVILPDENTNQTKKWAGAQTDGSVPFDCATEQLRTILGLLKLADEWYGTPGEYLGKHLR